MKGGVCYKLFGYNQGRFLWLWLVGILFFWGNLFGQSNEISSLPPLQTIENLPHNITDFAQDAQGFLWLGLTTGVAKYDGYQLTKYINNPNDTFSISGGGARSLVYDKEGKMWVGFFGEGIDVYTPKTNKFQHLKEELIRIGMDLKIMKLYIDKQERLWIIAQKGIAIYNFQSKQFKNL